MTVVLSSFYISSNCRNAALALPILAFTSASDPPCSSMMLSRYVKDSTSSRVSPSTVIDLVGALCVVFENVAFPLAYVAVY